MEHSPDELRRAEFRFYAELNDFLPAERRGQTLMHRFPGHPSVKDRIEALGVPHTEVEMILVNGEAVNFTHLLRDGDRIEVYPASCVPDLSPPVPLRPPLPFPARFVLDIHLGQLAEYLRLTGFDTLYRNDYPDEELARISREQERILLTKDRGLLKRKEVTYGYCVRETDPKTQVVEVFRRFALFGEIAPFRRCLRCNGLLERVEKSEIEHLLLPRTRLYYDEFSRCRKCGQVYWKGPHYNRMVRFIEEVRRG